MWIARIKSLKKNHGVTYKDIAKACKVPKSRVSKWFNGDVMPEPEYVSIMYNEFFETEYSADRLETLFSFAYDEKHTIDGQIDICEAAAEEERDEYKYLIETKAYLNIESMVGLFVNQIPWNALKLIIDHFDPYLDKEGRVEESKLSNDDWDKILSGLWNCSPYQKYYNRALLILNHSGLYKFEEVENE